MANGCLQAEADNIGLSMKFGVGELEFDTDFASDDVQGLF